MRSVKSFIILCLVLTIVIVAGCADTSSNSQKSNADNVAEKDTIELLVFSGAGLKGPMEDIKKAYESEHNVKIKYTYGGSSHLLSQIELSGKGDVFISGSMDAFEAADEKGLVNPCKKVAYHIPVIGVPKGNPAGIESLEDLAKPGVRVILGDEEANAIGKAAQRIIKKTGLDGINANVVAKTATVNELVTHLTTTDVDAAIVTADSIVNNEEIEMIEIPEEVNSVEIIPVCTLKNSKYPDLSKDFMNFVASGQGKSIFKKHGFEPVK